MLEYASPLRTQGGSRMRESRTYGSVRGALSNERPYRDRFARNDEMASPGATNWRDGQITSDFPKSCQAQESKIFLFRRRANQ
jgi:hypothetical protein